MTDAAPPTPRRIARLVLAIVGVTVVVLALALYAARKVIAREALTGWLQSKGVASEAEVEAFGLTGFTGRLRVGDPRNPDFAAERAEVSYRIKGLGVEVSSVRLTRPVLRARLHDGKLSAGALDPLIAEFRKRPPRPDAKKPRVQIDNGLLLLATDYGSLRLAANATVNDGKLMSLAATSAPARLKGEAFDVGLGAANLRLTTRADRTDVTLDAPIVEARSGEAKLSAGRLQLVADAPYPDLVKKRGDGRLVVRADLTAGALALGAQQLSDAHLSSAVTGQASGWITDLTVAGQGVADLTAHGVSLGGGRAETVKLSATASDLRWTRKGGDAVSAVVRAVGSSQAVTVSSLRLTSLSGALQGPVALGRGGPAVHLQGNVVSRGAWSGLGPVGPLDSREIAAVKRAARGFRLAAPGVVLDLDHGSLQVDARQAVRLVPDAGGTVTLARKGTGWRLTSAGGGLPAVTADVSRVALVPGGASASGRIKAALSIGPIQQGVFDASGTLRLADGMRFTADRCAEVKAAKLEFGVNDVEALSGRFCPTAGRPLLTFAGGGWELAGRAENAAARVPFLQARIAQASGPAVLGMTGQRLHMSASITAAEVIDTAPAVRFHPLRMTGRAGLAQERWTADLAFRTPAGQPVATAALRHDGRAGRGGVAFDTGVLTFAEGGLQPVQLSPLAQAVGSPASGTARFTGAFDWTPAGATSSGTLSVPRMDFKSPAGAVTGLSGTVVFTSLAPLVAAPGQVLHAETVAAFFPLTDVTATFGLESSGLTISGGQAAVGGGKVTIESLVVPLTPDQPTHGVLQFEGVQLHDLVEASPFGDRVDLDAKVSGRVPFEITAQRQVRILGGSLKAIEPGRLSIQRTALSSVATEGEVTASGPAPAKAQTTDTITDFAYQAMENLAFNTLDATIESRPDGRLGVLFHIIGEHDPPTKQEIRLTIMDLIRRDFLNRPLPLPSGTGVNLTLDTTLNLDDLLKDYAEYQRLRSSPTVQP